MWKTMFIKWIKLENTQNDVDKPWDNVYKTYKKGEKANEHQF